MSVRGLPQSDPSTQTRGILVGRHHRVWLNVFPDTTGLTTIPR
jgi:hypothetical protein